MDTSAVLTVDGPTGIAHIRVDTATAQNDIVLLGNANDRLTADARRTGPAGGAGPGVGGADAAGDPG